MTGNTSILSSVHERLCELTDNRFDRRYQSLTPLQKLVTMGLSVGAIVFLWPRVTESGLVASLAVPVIGLGLYAVLTTLFAWQNRR